MHRQGEACVPAIMGRMLLAPHLPPRLRQSEIPVTAGRHKHDYVFHRFRSLIVFFWKQVTSVCYGVPSPSPGGFGGNIVVGLVFLRFLWFSSISFASKYHQKLLCHCDAPARCSLNSELFVFVLSFSSVGNQ